MDNSVFTDKAHMPNNSDLQDALGAAYTYWDELKTYVLEKVAASEEWNYSKMGWNCRIKDKKRVIIYLMPCNGFFRASFVLGKHAVQEVQNSSISDKIKNIIAAAKTYAEGTGFRIDVQDELTTEEIKTLVDAKLKN